MNEQALDTNQAKTKQPNKQITQKTTTHKPTMMSNTERTKKMTMEKFRSVIQLELKT